MRKLLAFATMAGVLTFGIGCGGTPTTGTKSGTKPAPTKPKDDTTKPKDDTTKPKDDTTKPKDDTTKPKDDTTKPKKEKKDN